jgi:aryl-alcohol dehydrogenase-like predicted oxidoreductase
MSGLDLALLSGVGLGCNNFGMTLDLEQSRAVVDAAISNGVTFFDTADVYGATKSESFLGEILGARRGDVVIATKFGCRSGGLAGGARAAYVVEACEASLRRLRTDYIDLFMLHYPASWMRSRGYPDADVPISETLEGLNRLVDKGLIRAAGCSNFSLAELEESIGEAQRTELTGFAVVQNELSLVSRAQESTVLPVCDRTGIAFVPYFPLASGLLTGKYSFGAEYPAGSRMAFNNDGMWAPLFSSDNFALVDRLSSWARSHGRTLIEVAFGWLLGHPSVPSVIAGATSPQQVEQNVAAGRCRLSEAEMRELQALLESG